MTDNEIIKALEICGNIDVSCKRCVFANCELCRVKLAENAFILINRHQAEKEALIAGQETMSKYIEEQQAEIERLQKYNTDVAFKHYNDGIKEFVERLKGNADVLLVGKNGNYYSVSDKDINNLVKEMVGDTE